MGHIVHLKKFQSIYTFAQSYGFTIMLFTREKTQYLIFWEYNDPYLYKLASHSPMDAFCQVWFNMAMWFWRWRLLNSVTEFTLFHYHLPLEKGLAVHLNIQTRTPLIFLDSSLEKGHVPSFVQTSIPFTQECFVQSLAKIGPVVLE